jgi:hypothetical protein
MALLATILGMHGCDESVVIINSLLIRPPLLVHGSYGYWIIGRRTSLTSAATAYTARTYGVLSCLHASQSTDHLDCKLSLF